MIVPDRFERIRKLGEGGMGIVYEAYDRVRNMRVALKALRQINASRLYAFKREFRAIRDLAHPNIIALYDLIVEGATCFLTMEMVEGTDLLTYVRAGRAERSPTLAEDDSSDPIRSTLQSAATLLAPTAAELATLDMDSVSLAHISTENPTPVAVTWEPDSQAELRPDPFAAQSPMILLNRLQVSDLVDVERLRHVMSQLAGALATLHAAGLVHRDIKPSNVLVTGGGRVVLTDFGIVAETSQLSLLGRVVGTPPFMAPEQSRGDAPSAATDFYAFGVILYLALTGRMPFLGSNEEIFAAKQMYQPPPPRAFVDQIPPDLEALCMALLGRDPALRPSAQAVLETLGGVPDALPGMRPWLAHRPAAAPFVGRARERALLGHSYERIRDGGAFCVVVEGASGMGKSTLCDNILGALGHREDPQPLLLSGRCHERESLAYKALDGIIDQLCVHLDSLGADARSALMPADAGLLGRLFPVLRYLPEVDVALSGQIGAETLLGRDVRSRAIAALRALFAALGQKRPLIVRIEDIQWAERDSMELLSELLSMQAPARMLLVLTLRRESAERGLSEPLGTCLAALAERGACERIVLTPLSAEEQDTLVAELIEQNQVDPALGAMLREEAKGHPMLMNELARWAGEAPDAELGARRLGLDDILWQRIERLPAGGRALLTAMAIAGAPLPMDVLADITELAADERERAAAALVAGHLARVARMNHEQPWLDACHDKIFEAVMRRQDEASRRSLHTRTALALERWGKAPPAMLAHHWLSAGEPAKAVSHLLDAAEDAYEQLAYDRAMSLYQEVAVKVSEIGSSGAGSDPAADRVACAAWLGIAKTMRLQGKSGEALLDALAHAEPLAARHVLAVELATIHYLRGSVLFTRCDFDGCLAEHRKAHEFASSAASAEWEARALSGIGDAYAMIGRIGTALDHYDRCIELCLRFGFHNTEAANRGLRGTLRTFGMSYLGALDDFYRGIELARQTRDLRAEIICLMGLCLALIPMGRLDEADGHVDRLVSLAEGIGGIFTSYATAVKARYLWARQRDSEALAVAAAGIAKTPEHQRPTTAPLALGIIALTTTDEAERTRALRAGEEMVAAGTTSLGYIHMCLDAMELGVRRDEPELVERFARQLLDKTAEERFAWVEFVVARARALSAWQRGERTRAGQRALASLLGEAERAGLGLMAGALREALQNH